MIPISDDFVKLFDSKNKVVIVKNSDIFINIEKRLKKWPLIIPLIVTVTYRSAWYSNLMLC